MSSTITTTAEGDHAHRLHEAVVRSTTQIVESQQAAMEAMFCKLIECQAYNHHQMLELLTSINKGLAELNHRNVLLANSVPSNIQKEEAGEVVENELPGDNKQLHKGTRSILEFIN